MSVLINDGFMVILQTFVLILSSLARATNTRNLLSPLRLNLSVYKLSFVALEALLQIALTSSLLMIIQLSSAAFRDYNSSAAVVRLTAIVVLVNRHL